MKFNLNQLKLAGELCFPSDFSVLYSNNSKGTELVKFWHIESRKFWEEFNSDFLRWAFSHSRADLDNGIGKIINGMIEDLIGDYKG
jgi:hypothetical protein